MVVDASLPLVADQGSAVTTQQIARAAGIGEATPDRKVALHDTDARPIQKTTSARKLQFGYTGQVFDNTDGIILDYDIARHYPLPSRLLVTK